MSTIVTDAQLVAAHLAGDRSALAVMYGRYGDSLYDTAAAMTGSRHDAADIVQDVFVITAERVGQLRDPSRLKPWMFAILRNEVYRRTGKRRRTVAVDFSEPGAEMALPPDHPDPSASAEFDELAALVRGAALGLDERDQLVLELSVRQGLEGNDLADALGVSAQQSYSMVHRMRQRTERSLAAYCVARKGRRDCPELAEILRGWDEQFTVLIRKRVARHIDGCDICERNRRALAPFALFAGAPAFAAPAGLRDRVLAAAGNVQPAPAGAGAGGTARYGFARPDGFPSAIKYVHKLALWIVAAVAALVLVTGATVYVLADGNPSAPTSTTTTTTPANPTTVPLDTTPVLLPVTTTTTIAPTTSTSSTSSTSTSPTSTSSTSTTTSTTTTLPPTTTSTTTSTTSTTVPGALAVSAGTIDFGTSLGTARVRLSNPGGQPVSWSSSTGPLALRGTTTPFSFSPTSGTLQPGASVDVVFSVDRTWPTEGPVSQRVTFFAGNLTAPVDVRAEIARPPVILPIRVPPRTMCPSRGLDFSIELQDSAADLPTLTATLRVVYPGGSMSTQAFSPDIGIWFAFDDGDGDGDGLTDTGTFTWTITAADQHGYTSTLSGAMVNSYPDAAGNCP